MANIFYGTRLRRFGRFIEELDSNVVDSESQAIVIQRDNVARVLSTLPATEEMDGKYLR